MAKKTKKDNIKEENTKKIIKSNEKVGEVEEINEPIEEQNTVVTTRKPNRLNMNRPIYMYDFNGSLVGKFRGPTDAAKKLLGYNQNNIDIHDSHKIASLRTELSMYARSNTDSRSGVTFVQGYVPSYEELSVDEIVNNRKSVNVRGSKVLQYDFAGNLINVYENATDCAEKLGKSTAWVSILCNANSILRYDR